MSERGPQPVLGGPADAFVSERASAAPVRPATAKRVAVKKVIAARAATPIKAPLDVLERWFQAVITDPHSVEAGVASTAARRALHARRTISLDRLVISSPQMSGAERLGIYHYAYHARLVECLQDDFPVVQHALGCTAFTALCRDFINQHPSRHPNLNVYGGAFSDFCRTQATRLGHRGFIADLAALEWAMVEVVHAAPAATLSLDAFRALPPERWGTARFTPAATVRVVRFAHPVNEYLQAVRDERSPKIPRRRWSATAIYRQGFTVWRMDLDRRMDAILTRLFAGDTLGQALGDALAVARSDPAELTQRVLSWFREWVSGGFFAQVELDG